MATLPMAGNLANRYSFTRRGISLRLSAVWDSNSTRSPEIADFNQVLGNDWTHATEGSRG